LLTALSKYIGHYTSYVRNDADYYRLNDSKVTYYGMNKESVQDQFELETKDPYIAFYIKVGSEVDQSIQNRDRHIREPIDF
jgi:ubiquitin C-terminal hydrolase